MGGVGGVPADAALVGDGDPASDLVQLRDRAVGDGGDAAAAGAGAGGRRAARSAGAGGDRVGGDGRSPPDRPDHRAAARSRDAARDRRLRHRLLVAVAAEELPAGTLKIDRSFVRDLPHDAASATLTETIVRLARGVGMEPLAEGIETEAQRRFLVERGCRLGQGFLFGKPVPAAQIEADWLHRSRRRAAELRPGRGPASVHPRTSALGHGEVKAVASLDLGQQVLGRRPARPRTRRGGACRPSRPAARRERAGCAHDPACGAAARPARRHPRGVRRQRASGRPASTPRPLQGGSSRMRSIAALAHVQQVGRPPPPRSSPRTAASVRSSSAARPGWRSTQTRWPRFSISAASCPDFPPGAAHRSSTRMPGSWRQHPGGTHRRARLRPHRATPEGLAGGHVHALVEHPRLRKSGHHAAAQLLLVAGLGAQRVQPHAQLRSAVLSVCAGGRPGLAQQRRPLLDHPVRIGAAKRQRQALHPFRAGLGDPAQHRVGEPGDARTRHVAGPARRPR